MKKICKDCSKEKDIKDFYGVQGECKECTNKRVHLHYTKNLEHYKKYEVIRNKRPERKKQRLLSQQKQRKNNPIKYLARGKVLRALKSGLLFKKPCKICGIKTVEAHHPDYNKPLEVEWYCKKHHFEVDKLLKLKIVNL